MSELLSLFFVIFLCVCDVMCVMCLCDVCVHVCMIHVCAYV